jgi:hypothetical protein
MKNVGAVLACLLVAGSVLGCNTLGRQPRLENASIAPASLMPEQSAVITVKLVDKQKVVDRVVGVVVEDPRMKFPLRDDGVAPDQEAGDNVWSLQVDVPHGAPPGQFTLELTAFSAKGEAIVVRKSKSEEGPLTATCTLVIEYPAEEAGATEAPDAAASEG